MEVGQFEAASDWMRSAFKSFYGNFGEHDGLTQNAYDTLVQIEKALGSGLEHVPINSMPKMLVEVEQQPV